MATAKHRLHVKRLDTVGFVDRGDDPAATVVFFKRREQPVQKYIEEKDGKFCVYSEDGKKLGEHDSRDDAEAQLRAIEANKGKMEKLPAEGAGAAANGQEQAAPTPTEEATMFDVTKLSTEAQAEFKKLTDKVTELEGQLNPPKPAPLPADVQKKIDETEKRANDLAEQVQKLQDQREAETFIAKAKALSLPADDFGSILRKISKALTAEEMTKLETTLKALAEQVRQAGLFKEIGRGGTGAATETEAKVAELVKEVRKANPTWAAERAHGEVMKNHPALRRALEEERMSRTLQTGKED